MLFAGRDEAVESEIEGLGYVPDYMSAEQAQQMLQRIDSQIWRNDLKRRVQHYGYAYDYKARRVGAESYLGALPDWLESLGTRLQQDGYFRECPNQVIVNEYLPGQGISAHIDCIPCFGEVVASVSIGSAVIMDFAWGNHKVSRYLEGNSLVVLSGAARMVWTHAIPARKYDVVCGVRIPRGRRVSLTFRTVLHG